MVGTVAGWYWNTFTGNCDWSFWECNSFAHIGWMDWRRTRILKNWFGFPQDALSNTLCRGKLPTRIFEGKMKNMFHSSNHKFTLQQCRISAFHLPFIIRKPKLSPTYPPKNKYQIWLSVSLSPALTHHTTRSTTGLVVCHTLFHLHWTPRGDSIICHSTTQNTKLCGEKMPLEKAIVLTSRFLYQKNTPLRKQNHWGRNRGQSLSLEGLANFLSIHSTTM